MSSNKPPHSLPEESRRALLKIAAGSIEHALREGEPLKVDLAALPQELREVRATFVTLERHGQLRGCIGTLNPMLPLAEDVAHNAFQAAFRDPRFPPLSDREFRDLDIHISVLSPSEPMSFKDEQDLLRQIRPGVDGLVLEDGWHRGTFLPAVWDDLPDATDFLKHLKLKAGLPPDYWSKTLKVSRYTAEYFP